MYLVYYNYSNAGPECQARSFIDGMDSDHIAHSLQFDSESTLSSCRNQSYDINREYVYSVAVYQKYLTRLGELVIFEPIYLSTSDLLRLLFLTPTNMNLAVYGIELAFVMTS